MGDRVMPAVLAVGGGAVLACLLFVPFVAASYRRRGALGWGRALLATATLVYALAIVTYTLLPLPEADENLCRSRIALAGPQLRPFGFLGDLGAYDVTNPLRNPALLQVLFNVVLFVPLGAFVRYLGRRSVLTATLVGAAVSLLVECTQLTGVWFLYPCPYRLFDVDDLIANTLGALIGALLGPLLRIVPGQRVGADPGRPRPVTVPRRLLGVLCDLLGTWLTGAFLVVGVNGVLYLAGTTVSPTPAWLSTVDTVLGTWVPWAVLFVLVPLLGRGGTVGQRAVLLRPVAVDGTTPSRGRLLARSLLGVGGYLLLEALEVPGGLAGLFGLVSLVGILAIADRRGIAGLLTGTVLVDRRLPAPATEDPARTRDGD